MNNSDKLSRGANVDDLESEFQSQNAAFEALERDVQEVSIIYNNIITIIIF